MSFVKGFIWGVVIASLFEVIFYFIPFLRANFWDNPKLIFGFHFHHSIIGLVFLLIGAGYLKKDKLKAVFLIGFGLAVIFVHTLTDGRLIFVE